MIETHAVDTGERLACGLRLDEIPSWAETYETRTPAEVVRLENWLHGRVGPRSRKRGYIEASDFLHVCGWISREARQVVEGNDAALIEAKTAQSLQGELEAQRMAPLVLLEGVTMPTASAVLHFTHPVAYPYIHHDVLWGLGISPPNAYKMKFWSDYTTANRAAAEAAGTDLHTLRRAIVAYAAERRPAIG